MLGNYTPLVWILEVASNFCQPLFMTFLQTTAISFSITQIRSCHFPMWWSCTSFLGSWKSLQFPEIFCQIVWVCAFFWVPSSIKLLIRANMSLYSVPVTHPALSAALTTWPIIDEMFQMLRCLSISRLCWDRESDGGGDSIRSGMWLKVSHFSFFFLKVF